MLFQHISTIKLVMLILAFEHKIFCTTATNLAQLKNQQPTQQQQQLHQTSHQPIPQQQHEKDSMQDVIKNVNSEEDLSDPYQMLNELKNEPRLPSINFPWNPHTTQHTAIPQNILPFQAHPFEGFPSLYTPKFLPFLGFSQALFMPLSFLIAPEMFYPTFPDTSNDLEDTMSRTANGRRPTPASANTGFHRNSPIYYVRLPPTPYMFLPSLGYSSSPPTTSFGAGFSSVLPYQSMPTFSAFSSIFNLPVNFIANGKPSNIYQMGGSPNDIQSPLSLAGPGLNSFGSRPQPVNSYKPTGISGYLQQAPYGIAAIPPAAHQDSKMTSLKRPFLFNGRPEDIFIMPNNFNTLYSDSGYY